MPQRVFPSRLDEIPAIEAAIQADLEAVAFPERAVFAIRLTIAEALANAVRHGNQSDPGKNVTATWDITAEKFTLSVEDEGPGFDPDAVPDCTLCENLTIPSGRGVMLMRAYMTEVNFNQRGNRVTLVKRADCPLPDDA